MATAKLLRLPPRLAPRCTSYLLSPAPCSPWQRSSSRAVLALYPLSRHYASKSFPPHTVLAMPSLSPTMEMGNISTWHIDVGDKFSEGDVLVEIETDKATMDFVIEEDGVLAKILRDSGAKDIPVGTPIGVYVQSEQDVAAFKDFSAEDAPGPASATGSPKEEKTETTQQASAEPADSESAVAQESDSTGARLETVLDRSPKISPAATKLALEKGVPIGQIKGTGRGGQITKEDIGKFKPAASTASAAGPEYEDTAATSMRKTIAARLTQSMQQSPHYFVSTRMSVTKLLKLRAALNADAQGAYKLSVNDLLIKAVAIAALKVPAANSSWRDDGQGRVTIREHKSADVCVAVATPAGLVTPIVRGAHARGLASISADVRDMGKRARDGKLRPDEYQGGSITISNMGMNHAVERFTAVINPPQAAIVAVGTVQKVAVPEVDAEEGAEPGVVWDDQIVLTGSFDHKVVDGAVGGEFMRELKEVIENPLKFML